MSGLEIDPYVLSLSVLGAVMLGVAGLPLLIRELPLSVPMTFLLLGGLVGVLFPASSLPDPPNFPELTERATEFLVIVSLTGAGLKLDTPIGWRRWAATWRLLIITMPLSIAAIALIGWGMLGLPLASALLLGAALAPTDPVLASSVQVAGPGEGDGPRVRFVLTSEAGLNDGLAFPFVNLAVALALQAGAPGPWFLEWLAVDVLWKLAAGLGVGWSAGWLAAWLLFRSGPGSGIAESRDGFVAVGLTLLAYGMTELVHGYGFIGVFVAALTLRATERDHSYHRHLHDFAEEIERLSLALMLLVLGASFTSLYLQQISLATLAAALLILLVVRPLAGYLALLGTPGSPPERLAIAFFGIRGMGSFYYLAYAVTAAEFERTAAVWSVVIVVVVLSIRVHGGSATPALRRLERDAG